MEDNGDIVFCFVSENKKGGKLFKELLTEHGR